VQTEATRGSHSRICPLLRGGRGSFHWDLWRDRGRGFCGDKNRGQGFRGDKNRGRWFRRGRGSFGSGRCLSRLKRRITFNATAPTIDDQHDSNRKHQYCAKHQQPPDPEDLLGLRLRRLQYVAHGAELRENGRPRREDTPRRDGYLMGRRTGRTRWKTDP
jgi:hypothetical protein